MTSYLSLVSKYFSAHQAKSRLVILSVAISVAMITGIFSMLDAFQQFEKTQIIHDTGNYHLALKDPTDREMQIIDGRIDIQNTGIWISFKRGSLEEKTCSIGALEERFAKNFNFVPEGNYPKAYNEIMLERWAASSYSPPLGIGDTVNLRFSDDTTKQYFITGLFDDLGSTKAADVPGVILSLAASKEVAAEKVPLFLIEFKDRVTIADAEKSIKSTLQIADDRIVRNEKLLAVIGQSTHNTATGLYVTGAVLFAFVLFAGVLMIFNTFNISVAERVRQFGLLRCIGASRSQIKSLVRREGLYITLRAIPLGVIAGMLIALCCSALLKFYNSNLFHDMPLFQFSIWGIVAGVVIGFLTVFIASLLPARKASNISPITAMSGNAEIRMMKKQAGSLTKLFPIEIAMGINNAIAKKRTLILMSSSIAISIMLFLGFQVFVDFMHTNLKTTKPYTPDISLVSTPGIDAELHRKLTALDGINKTYGRMFDHVDASFDASRLTDFYKESMGGIPTKADGTFDPPEQSWLISYDRDQFDWAKEDLLEGEISEQRLNEQNGIIAVVMHLRKGITSETTNFKLGDNIKINTPQGPREMKVMGILRTVPFSDDQLDLTTFITTEKLFSELTGKSSYQAIDMQLKGSEQEQTVAQIKSLVDSSISFHDLRQRNAETNQTFFTMAVFIYGFVALIGLISVLNIINTMNTSVASKTHYLGILRAVGMSDAQLNSMVFAEAATYSLIGAVLGCLLGIALQKWLSDNMLSTAHVVWKLPSFQLVGIIALVLIVTVVSIIGPLKRVKSRSPSEVISSL
jgi:putative ABC transport system permease protein